MPSKCQVDFYVLQSATQAAPRLACRLALMAWEKGGHIFVAVSSADDLRELDDLMWNYPPERFLPHRLAGPIHGASGTGTSDKSNPSEAPITLGTREQLAKLETDGVVMINLTAKAVTEPQRCGRILEIVPFGEQDRTDSRDKFKQYRELGLDPASHEIKVSTTA